MRKNAWFNPILLATYLAASFVSILILVSCGPAAGFAVACICSIWGMVPMMLRPHRNMELCMEFGPKFCGDELYVGCHAMTEPSGGSDIENFGQMKGKTIQTTATADGDEWVINGHKIWATNSGSIADLFVVVCTTAKRYEFRPRQIE